MRVIGRLELISTKYEEFERFYQMKGFPKKHLLVVKQALRL